MFTQLLQKIGENKGSPVFYKTEAKFSASVNRAPSWKSWKKNWDKEMEDGKKELEIMDLYLENGILEGAVWH